MPTEAEDADGYGHGLGVRVTRTGDTEVYGHVGYWGTAAYYVPALGIALAGFVAERDRRPSLIDAMLGFVATIGGSSNADPEF